MALDAAHPTALLALTLLALLPLTALVALRAIRRGGLPLRAWSTPVLVSTGLAGVLLWGLDAGLPATASVGVLVPVMMTGLTRGRPGALARGTGALVALVLLALAPHLAASGSTEGPVGLASASARQGGRAPVGAARGGSPPEARRAMGYDEAVASAPGRSARPEAEGIREARRRDEGRHRDDGEVREGRRRRDDDHRGERDRGHRERGERGEHR